MILPKRIVFVIIWCIFFTLPFSANTQTLDPAFKKSWEQLSVDTLTNQQKLDLLDRYIEKAQRKKNKLEEYKALKKKTFLLPFNEAVLLLHKMNPLAQNLKNDSLWGDFLIRNTILYYSNRHFKEALDYAIQAEKFNAKINNLYNLNSARVDIGNIYYHTQYYQKAKDYFLLANTYYKKVHSYKHLQGYMCSLYNLGKCYWMLEDVKQLQQTIHASNEALPRLKPEDEKFEAAYLNFLKGGNAYLNKAYNQAQLFFESALPEIKKNNDLANEHIIYMYLGKIKWQQGQKEQAVAYFTKVDSLFKHHKFLNFELRETYTYLRTYYKETHQNEALLETTERLIALNQQFEKEQQHIGDVLHYQLETQQLQADKNNLQNQMQAYKLRFIGVGALTLLLFGTTVFWFLKRKKQPQTHLVSSLPIKQETPASIATTVVSNAFSIQDLQNTAVLTDKANTKAQLPPKLTATEQRLFEQLRVFENEKQFKQTITLEELALQFGTNRTTLSNFLNTHKGGYNAYLSKLRVAEVMKDLKNDKTLCGKTLQELANSYGFSNAKAFSSQFKTETGNSPLAFIKSITQTNTCV